LEYRSDLRGNGGVLVNDESLAHNDNWQVNCQIFKPDSIAKELIRALKKAISRLPFLIDQKIHRKRNFAERKTTKAFKQAINAPIPSHYFYL